ncbi:hypothetical protein, partial [Methylobacterium sp. Leaf117]|uniref:hypothetical protein n=1 Tax=Methylobacterium sp. Leaf117 TaxID=1736260 RepID=UPI001AEC7210
WSGACLIPAFYASKAFIRRGMAPISLSRGVMGHVSQSPLQGSARTIIAAHASLSQIHLSKNTNNRQKYRPDHQATTHQQSGDAKASRQSPWPLADEWGIPTDPEPVNSFSGTIGGAPGRFPSHGRDAHPQTCLNLDMLDHDIGRAPASRPG